MFQVAKEEKTIALRCKQVLEEKGVPIDELAKLVSRPPSTVSEYLDGSLRIPLSVLAEISKLTGSSLDWLVAGQWLPDLGLDAEQREQLEPANQLNNKWAELIVQEIKEGFSLLTAVIDAIDKHLRDNDLQLDSNKKAELIIKLYEVMAEKEGEQIDHNTVAQLIKLTS